MHYYQFNIGDYHGHTGYLSLLEDLAYRRILDTYYLSESPLPNDPEQIARKIGMRENVEEVKQVLNDFFILTDGLYTNKRVERELESYRAKADTARANGKKGGRPSKSKETQGEPSGNPEETQPVILANPDETGSKAKHKPITNNQETINKDIKTLDQSALDREKCFEMFWNSGIRKVNKKKAKTLFINLLKKEALPENFTLSLCDDVTTRLDSDQLGFAQMHPTTYLNGERWNDEVTHETHQQPNQPKPSLIDRVKANVDKRRRDREADWAIEDKLSGRDAMAENDCDVRPQILRPVRGDAGRDMGNVLDGDFWETDG